ncbi:major facilitator superfamily domain-containing protein 6-like [Scleropages formosus]|uniref:Major facilitator superfamily domain containing 6-like n=1 Tax=Scleropages formosus TaxID=113540 RepID=A0A8C9UZY3_SCLFO|nr:major facilitator superfamily domain-containing protein 6-like [Scleropages formosus]XP_018612493.2 major facilitator superfamily domain-containing protein 6-like [Scleropages formosus]
MRSSQWDVRGAVALASTFRLLHGCAWACLLPFLTLYLRHLGLTASTVGIIMGTKHLIGVVWGPASAFLAKRYDRRRAVLVGSLLCSTGASLLILLIPAASEEALTLHCNITRSGFVGSADPSQDVGNSTSAFGSVTLSAPLATLYSNLTSREPSSSGAVMTSPNKATTYTSDPHAHGTVSRTVQAETEGGSGGTGTISAWKTSQTPPSGRGLRSTDGSLENNVGYDFLGSLKTIDAEHQLFFLILMAVGLWEVLAAPLDRTAADGLFEYLDFVDAADRYGTARGWGLLGAAVGACSLGLLVSSLSCLIAGGRAPRSVVHFYGHALFMVLALPAASLLPMYRNRKRETASKALKALQLVSGEPRALLCAATAFLAGVAASMVSDFLFWQMQDNGSTELQMGFALALALLSQLTFRLLSRRVPQVLTRGKVLWMSTACLALQCLYYSFLWAPWSVLPVQPLSALSAGALWWAVREQCEDVTTPGMERQVREVFRGASAGLGASLGSFMGGLVAQWLGVPTLFRGAAVVLALWAVSLPFFQSRTPYQRRINYSRLLTADASEASDSESDQDRDWLVKAMKDDDGNNSW